jgi:molybdenum cofactor biosynthesis enzyme MoaA
MAIDEILIKLLDYCEMHCHMCSQLSQANRRTVLSASKLFEYLSAFNLQGQRVYLWGGEPLLHPELLTIVSTLKDRGAVVAINTNGYAFADHGPELVARGVDRVIFSLDGLSVHTHDGIRGMRGSHARITSAIAMINALRPTGHRPLIRVNSVALASNFEEIPALASWCRNNGIYKVHFQLPMFLTRSQVDAYASLALAECGCKLRNYDTFLHSTAPFEFHRLAHIMATVKDEFAGFARFHPFECLTGEELRSYYMTDAPLKSCQCDVIDNRISIDSSGRLVTCPDFPDLAYGDLSSGITNPERLAWLSRRLRAGSPLPTCSRCCHFVPMT